MTESQQEAMGLTDATARAHWDHVYESKETAAVSWYQEVPRTSLELIAASPHGRAARVLDVGGGASGVAAHLLASGYRSVGVLDVSASALRIARETLGERAADVEWFVADVRQFNSPHPWDVWHDRAVFHFLTEPQDRAAYRRVLEATVPAGGMLVMATFGPQGPQRCSGLPTMRYGPDELATELGAAFALRDSRVEEHRTPAGRVQQFLYTQFDRTNRTT